MNEPNTTADRIAGLWRSVLKVEHVDHETSFVDLGGDSLLLLSLLTEIENTFGVYVEAEDIIDDLTVRGMSKAVGSALALP